MGRGETEVPVHPAWRTGFIYGGPLYDAGGAALLLCPHNGGKRLHEGGSSPYAPGAAAGAGVFLAGAAGGNYGISPHDAANVGEGVCGRADAAVVNQTAGGFTAAGSLPVAYIGYGSLNGDMAGNGMQEDDSPASLLRVAHSDRCTPRRSPL